MRILCGDIGGTNTRLAVWDGALAVVRYFPGSAHATVQGPLSAWLAESGVRPDAACLAVAGPVTDDRCVATNLPWIVDGEELSREYGFPFHVVNDFAAAARGTTLLKPTDVVQLGGESPVPAAPVAVLGAGTGLGEALLVGNAVVAGEGGHAEFGPSTEREARLAAWLIGRFGRASWEHVLSGRGLVNLLQFCCFEVGRSPPAWVGEPDAPARVVDSEPEVVAWFAELYGSEAGNMALRVIARGGVYLAGGIAPRIVNVLEQGGFRRRFEAKGAVGAAIRDIPAYVITHPHLGLLGAAASWER